MARYQDYVQKQDQVAQELNAQPVKTYNIPDSVKTRFAGKTNEEIMESFAEAQTLISRQGHELGELRKATASLLELQSQPVLQETPKPAVPEKGITVDDLYEDTEGAIATVVEKKSIKTSERIAALEAELAKRTARDIEVALESKYSGWRGEITRPEFVEWVKSSPVRVRLFTEANQYDVDSANDLLELWYDRKGMVQQAKSEVQREQQFRDASLETSGPTDVEQVPTFSRSDLQEKRIASKMGNRQAERWLAQHGPSITLAYQEGRITD